MKISKIYIRDFDQFQDVELDFTDPGTGESVEKVCFIGRNRTGKSKILRLINWFFNCVLDNLKDSSKFLPVPGSQRNNSRIIFKIVHEDEHLYIFYFYGNVEIFHAKEPEASLINQLLDLTDSQQIWDFIKDKKLNTGLRHQDFVNNLIFKNNSTDLVIYSPDESGNNGYLNIKDVPETNVNDAQTFFQNLPFFFEVSANTVNDFWKMLVFNMRKREEERTNYETLPENINKTKANLIDEFDKLSPKILYNLAEIWNEILDSAGLEFDVKGANNPYQLKDNLKAYVKLKKSNQPIRYNELSTGIRNFIFRVGHINSLYFNRSIERGFLLIDEPENGLFPDFLFDLMRIYQKIVIDKDGNKNTQQFFATHNPIIAAQFKPFERIVLDWNDDGTVKVHKGIAPEGDDPNDVLTNDFELKDLMGPAGQKMWEKYRDLKKKLMRENDDSKKENLINQINQIGTLYNF